MDRTPGADAGGYGVRQIASGVTGVRAIEKLAVRKSGMVYRATIHVQADATLSLRDAHVLGGKVRSAIRAALPNVQERTGAHGAIRVITSRPGGDEPLASWIPLRRSSTFSHQRGCQAAATGMPASAPSVPNVTSNLVRASVASVANLES